MMNRLHAKWRELVTWYVAEAPLIAAVLAVMIAVFTTGAMSVGWKGWINFLSNGAVHGWAAAIATFFAGIVALAIASSAERKARKREYAAGELAAAQHLNHVVMLRLRCFDVTGKLPKKDPPPPADGSMVKRNDDLLNMCVNAARHIGESFRAIPIDTIQPYSPEISALIAYVIDQMKTAEETAPRSPSLAFQHMLFSEANEICLRLARLMHAASKSTVAPYVAALRPEPHHVSEPPDRNPSS